MKESVLGLHLFIIIFLLLEEGLSYSSFLVINCWSHASFVINTFGNPTIKVLPVVGLTN